MERLTLQIWCTDQIFFQSSTSFMPLDLDHQNVKENTLNLQICIYNFQLFSFVAYIARTIS